MNNDSHSSVGYISDSSLVVFIKHTSSLFFGILVSASALLSYGINNHTALYKVAVALFSLSF